MLMTNIYSYVVRYDSGFAPNPFYGYCTLATCKPSIRRSAYVGDWVIGCGSNEQSIKRGGYLVYAMRVTEIMTFDEYNEDERFVLKQPFRNGSRKQSCGDNIYFRSTPLSIWQQRDSFHSKEDGTIQLNHVARDTGVNRVLISEDFIYFGGEGPKLPEKFVDNRDRSLCKRGIGYSKFNDPQLISDFEQWFLGQKEKGFVGFPYEWLDLRR